MPKGQPRPARNLPSLLPLYSPTRVSPAVYIAVYFLPTSLEPPVEKRRRQSAVAWSSAHPQAGLSLDHSRTMMLQILEGH